MSYTKIGSWLEDELQSIHDAGLFKQEKIINWLQGSHVDTQDGAFINVCANNYLSLADHPEVVRGRRMA